MSSMHVHETKGRNDRHGHIYWKTMHTHFCWVCEDLLEGWSSFAEKKPDLINALKFTYIGKINAILGQHPSDSIGFLSAVL